MVSMKLMLKKKPWWEFIESNNAQISSIEEARDNPTSPEHISFVIDGKTSLETMDRQIIQKALELTGQNISKAAELLGATRETLRYRIQKYELDSTA